ncbi:MAG: dienelactone hydrolase family protein, partial [Acidimicrobiia bacterium]
AEEDEFITDDEAAFMEATMGLESLSVEVIRYPKTKHGFCEPDGDTFDPEAFERAWAATLDFLAAQLSD